jgi:hypothetical protein
LTYLYHPSEAIIEELTIEMQHTEDIILRLCTYTKIKIQSGKLQETHTFKNR